MDLPNVISKSISTDLSIIDNFDQVGIAIMLSRYNGKSIEDTEDDYPQYYRYRFDFKSAKRTHEILVRIGLLEYRNSFDYSKIKVTDIKDILKTKQLLLKGNKDDLIKRLRDNFEDEELLGFGLRKSYHLSDYGMLFVKSHDASIKLFENSNWNITIEEYTVNLQELSKNNESIEFIDVILNIFNKRIDTYLRKKYYGNLRMSYYYMFEIYEKLGKKHEAMNALMILFDIDLSGMSNNNIVNSIQYMRLGPAIIHRIRTYDKLQLKNTFEKMSNKIQFPFDYFLKETKLEILNDLFFNPDLDLNEYMHFIPQTNHPNYNYYGL